MADLIAPHGGLNEPVNCTVAAGDVARITAEAAGLVKVPVSDADLSTVYRFGDGVLSPLTGPMDSAAYNRVLDESVIEHDGKLYAWTIPLALPVTAELAGQLKPGQRVALDQFRRQRSWPRSTFSDVFAWDKPRYIKSVYLTERTDHPGADMVLKGDADKTHLVGGTIHVLPQPKHPTLGKYVLPPREVRKLLASKGWNRGRRVSNPQSAPPGPRIRTGLRAGNAAAGRAQRRGVSQSADRRDQGRRRQRRRSACKPTKR